MTLSQLTDKSLEVEKCQLLLLLESDPFSTGLHLVFHGCYCLELLCDIVAICFLGDDEAAYRLSDPQITKMSTSMFILFSAT